MKQITLLAFCLSFALNLAAQVGVNTPNPSQTLDVNGKLEIGDDQITPTEGTLRYNDATKNFEGFNGTGWSALNNEPQFVNNDAIPEGAIVVYGESPAISNNDETDDCRIYYGDGSFNFERVPNNMYLIVTWINIRDNDINPSPASILARVGPRTSNTAFLIGSRSIYISGAYPDAIWMESSLAPIVIVRPGEYLAISNSRFSEDVVHLQMRGFLVPALDY